MTDKKCTSHCDECEVQCTSRSILITLPPTIWEAMEDACDIIGTSPGRIIQELVFTIMGKVLIDALETAELIQHYKSRMN